MKKFFIVFSFVLISLAALSGGFLMKPKTISDEAVSTVKEIQKANLPVAGEKKKIVLPALDANQISEEELKNFEIDSDNDGLTDFLESFYGTNPQNRDSDDDGFLDGEEVEKGYSPLGQGRL